MKPRRMAIVAVIISVTLTAGLLGSACTKEFRSGIVIAVKEMPARLDPVSASSPSEENACELIFDGLVNIAANDSGTASPVLGLAESIIQDQSDRSLFRITLRDVLWHDGRTLGSDDVTASFAAYIDPANHSSRREYLLALVASMVADGKRRVLVRFHEPIAEFRAWYVLAFKIVPRDFQSKASPVGTGPFRLQSRSEGEIVFAANKSCYRGAPASELLILRHIASNRERVDALLKGKVDVIADTGPLDGSRLDGAGDVMVQSYMPHAFYTVAMNLRNPVLAKLEARVALVRAIDRSTLVPGLSDRAAGVELNNGPFPNSLLTKVLPEYFHQGFPDRHGFDTAVAVRLATTSGLASKKLRMILPTSWGEFGSRLSSGLVSQFARASIIAEPLALEDEPYRSAISARDFDLALVYHEGFDNLFSGISEFYRSGSPQNETGISLPSLDKMLARRDAAVEVSAWLSDTLALHDLISGLVPYIPLFTIEKNLFYRGVQGILIASDNPYLSAERWSRAVRK